MSEREQFKTADLVPAAVLIPLLIGDARLGLASQGGFKREAYTLSTPQGQIRLPSDVQVLLTVRTNKVLHHKGQISFPGGVCEPDDVDARYTALRESFEEIGLLPENVNVVAQLPDVPTVATKFLIHPFVGIIQNPIHFQLSRDETGEILSIPLAHLLNPAHSVLETYERNGLSYKIKAYLFESHRVWGATAVIIQTLLEKFIQSS